MRYVLDIVLVIGLVWVGYLWNGEKKAGLAQGDEIAKLNARAEQLQTDLAVAKDEGTRTATGLEAAQSQVEQLSKDLQEKTDALTAKSAEAEEMRTAAMALKARVDELQGYKEQAQKAVMVDKTDAPAP